MASTMILSNNRKMPASGMAVSASMPGERREGGNGLDAQSDTTALVRAAQTGDASAFEALVRHYDKRVLRMALHLSESEHDAQDIYQETFLRAYRNLPSFRFECSFYTWIYRIATNVCLDYLRRRHSRPAHSSVTVTPSGAVVDLLDSVPDHRPSSNPERDLMSGELRACITRALENVPPRERVVFELKHYQGLKLHSIAMILNTTEGTAKNMLFRVTQKLRSALAHVR